MRAHMKEKWLFHVSRDQKCSRSTERHPSCELASDVTPCSLENCELIASTSWNSFVLRIICVVQDLQGTMHRIMASCESECVLFSYFQSCSHTSQSCSPYEGEDSRSRTVNVNASITCTDCVIVERNDTINRRSTHKNARIS